MAELGKVIKALDYCTENKGFCGYDCPYYHEPFGCRTHMEKDALELLNFYKPHVMTLEEAKKNFVIWIEDYTDPTEGVEPVIRPAIIESAKNGGFLVIDSEETDDNDGLVWLSESDYGKEWRPWSDMPTRKQREETPWGK